MHIHKYIGISGSFRSHVVIDPGIVARWGWKLIYVCHSRIDGAYLGRGDGAMMGSERR